MSGHSKWSQIKRQKLVDDQKRGFLFSKLANAITIAVRQGGGITDPDANFHLRLAIDRAKQANMPKENIKRAIKRAVGDAGSVFEEIVYGGYGPGGAAIMVEAASDNRARTMQKVKAVFDRHGGRLVDRGAVEYLFTRVGLLTVDQGNYTPEEILSIVVKSGALDLEFVNNIVEVYTQADKLHQVKKKVESDGLVVRDAELVWRPGTLVSISDEGQAKKVLALTHALEELADVQKVYPNFDIPDSLLVKVS